MYPMMNKYPRIRQMEIWTVSFPYDPGRHTQGGFRPAIVVSGEVLNAVGALATVVPLTTNLWRAFVPTNVRLDGFGLDRPSLALCEQVRTVDKQDFRSRIGVIDDPKKIREIMEALSAQMGFTA